MRLQAKEGGMFAEQAKQSSHSVMLLHMAETWERMAATYQNGNS
jgi:hypothetical protein